MSHLYWNVEYNYAVNSQLPRPDLHRQDTQPYRLRPKAAPFWMGKVTTKEVAVETTPRVQP